MSDGITETNADALSSPTATADQWIHTIKFKQRAWFGDIDELTQLVSFARELMRARMAEVKKSLSVEDSTSFSWQYDADKSEKGEAFIQLGKAFRSRGTLNSSVDSGLKALRSAENGLQYASFVLGSTSRGSRIELIFTRMSGVQVKITGPERWAQATKASLQVELRTLQPGWHFLLSGWTYWATSVVIATTVMTGIALTGREFAGAPIVAGIIAMAAMSLQLFVPCFELLRKGKSPIAPTIFRVLYGFVGVLLTTVLTAAFF